MTDPSQSSNDAGLLARYGVDLLLAEPLDLSNDRLRSLLARQLERIAPGELVLPAGVEGERKSELTVERRGHGDSADPPRWTLRDVELSADQLADAVAQSWWWPEGADVLDRVGAAVAVDDDRFLSLDYRARLAWLRRVLAAVLECAPCLAIHWRPTQQLVDPHELLHTLLDQGFDSLLPGGYNVRLYRVDRGRPGDDEILLMDTLGLGAIGLVDLQCTFRGLAPDAVGGVLANTALYLHDHGVAIRPGDTIQGPTAGDRWLVRAGEALAPPSRRLLELDPGHPFAATSAESFG